MTTAREVKYERPPLVEYQERHIFCSERYAWIEASTKSGKTVGCLAWLLEQAMVGGKMGRNYWWVAPVIAQARIAYRRMKGSLSLGAFESNDTQMEIVLVNGAMLRFLGSDDPDNLYGEDVYAAVIDEASRCREEAFHALRTTLTATRGPLRIIGNVKGRKNWFYRGARQAEEGREGHHYARITAYDAIQAGILAQDEIDDARRSLPRSVYEELYEAKPSDDEGNPFGLQAIRDCTVAELSTDLPVVWGWDLAKSVDWTVGIGLDSSWRVCRFQRFQKPWLDTLMVIRQEVGQAPALVDSTGVGDPLVEAMTRGGMRAEGYRFSDSSKQQLMEGLLMAVQERRVRFPQGPISLELESFEYEYRTRDGRFTGVRYSAPEGQHDDCVVALALAVRHASDPRHRGRMGGSRLALPHGGKALVGAAFGNPMENGLGFRRRSPRLTH